MVLLIVLYVVLMFAIVFLPFILNRKQNTMVYDRPIEEIEAEIMSRDLHNRKIEKLLYRFDESFIGGQGYLDPDLTIVSVAKSLDTNRTYISEVVNTRYGMSFRDLVSKLRIEYAKKLLLDDPKMTIVAISGKSGFLGSNQFVRKFRELEGKTPAAWRKSKLTAEINSADINTHDLNPPT